jgi:hypothetical protein
MSENGKTKAEILEDQARERDQAFDDHARALVEKWMAEIRALQWEQHVKESS